jgi:branched-chain amino acid transport system permease protein
MTLLFQSLVVGIAVGAVYGLVALGFVLIYKSTGVLNVAQGGLVMLGAFFCYTAASQVGLPFPLAFLAALAASFVLGMLIDRVLLRPLVGQPLLAVVMMTIALLSAINGVVVAAWGVLYYTYPKVFPTEPLRLGEVVVSYEYVGGFLIAMVLDLIFILFFRYSSMGIQMRAVSEDQQAAQAAGVNVQRILTIAWGIGTLVAAVGGIILGMVSMVFYGLSFIGLKAFPVVILGGLESFGGAILGGLIVGILESLFGAYLEPYLGGIKEVAPFIILMIILLIKPYGLFGQRRIERI